MFPKNLFYAKESAVLFPSSILFSNMAFQPKIIIAFAEFQNNLEQFKKECFSHLDTLETKTKMLEQSVQKFEKLLKDKNFSNCSPVLESSKRFKKLFFRIQKVANDFGVLTQFHVSGSTEEIHKELDELGVSFWNEVNNTWDFYYEPQIYNRVLSLLKSHSDDVLEF
jgi:arginyl-tRNA synthetase